MGLLSGKVAVVTGAGNGIGRAHALALAAEGAAVLVNDIGLALRGGEGGRGLEPGPPRIEVAQRVVDEILASGGRAVADCTDVSNIERAGRVVAHAIDAFGGIDVLVNNAGTVHDASSEDLDDARFDAEFNTHVKGTMGTTRAAMRFWREKKQGGRIVNTISGFAGPGGLALYIAAKSAVASFTLTTARDGEPLGVAANAISPFAFTRQSRKWLGRVERDEEATFAHISPQQNSPLVVFLASDLSKGLNGRFFAVKPDEYSPTAGIRLREAYIDYTTGIAKSSGWTAQDIAAALPEILRPS